MDSTFSRANQIFAFSSSALSLLAALCWFTGQFVIPQGHANVIFEPKNMNVVNGYEARGIRTESQRLDMRYALRVDVSELFNWSVKELFVMLVAEYSTPKNVRNEITIWDRIIMREDLEKHVVTIKNGKPKYEIWDDGKYLKGRENVTFRLHWNTVTTAGTLPLSSGDGTVIKISATPQSKGQ